MKRICLLPLPLLLVACRSVGTTYTRPAQALPQAYLAPGGSVALAPAWWKTLGDHHLDALIQKALTQSPTLRIAEARLRQARALQGIQDAAGGLNVGLGASVSRDRISLNGEKLAFMPNRNLDPDMTNHQIGFDASWELDFFGHNRRLAEGAQARAEASAERLGDASLILAAEVTRAYVDLRTAQQRLRVAEESLETHHETVRLTELVVRTGEGTQVDLQRVQANRSAFEATLADLRLELRQQLATLAALTDTPIQDLERDFRDPSPLMAVPSAPAAGLPSELLEHRPDVRGAERDLAAASADVGVAKADRYPRFSLVGNGGWSSIQSGTLLANASRMWSVGPQMHLPLFTQGRLKNQVAANVAAYDAARATYRKTVLEALSDVEVALTRLSRGEERRLQMEATAERQRRILHLTSRQQEVGEVSRLNVLEARRLALLQEDQALRTQAQSLKAFVSLCKALGGGWNA